MRHFVSPEVTKAALAAAVVGCSLLAVSARAQAQDAGGAAPGQGFGAQGQIAINGELGAGFDKVNKGGWTFGIRPGADYFLLPAISAGGFAGFSAGNQSFQEVIVGARGGFNVNVTSNLGAWAKVGIAYDHEKNPQRNPMTPNVTVATTFLTVDVPIMFHIVPHLFVGLGPYYYLKITGDGNTGYGVHSLVGGWF